MPDYSFPKAHRLKRRRLIRPLFDRRRDDVETLTAGCVRLLWRVAPSAEVGVEAPLQIGFAPGRTRTAVRRNRIRRLLRETYRTTCQHDVRAALDECAGVLTVMVLFRSDPDATPDAAIRRGTQQALRRLIEHV